MRDSNILKASIFKFLETEYSAGNTKLRNGKITVEEFLQLIVDGLLVAEDRKNNGDWLGKCFEPSESTDSRIKIGDYAKILVQKDGEQGKDREFIDFSEKFVSANGLSEKLLRGPKEGYQHYVKRVKSYIKQKDVDWAYELIARLRKDKVGNSANFKFLNKIIVSGLE